MSLYSLGSYLPTRSYIGSDVCSFFGFVCFICWDMPFRGFRLSGGEFLFPIGFLVVMLSLFYLCVLLLLSLEREKGRNKKVFSFYDSDLMFWLPSIQSADSGRRSLRLIHTHTYYAQTDTRWLARTHTRAAAL